VVIYSKTEEEHLEHIDKFLGLIEDSQYLIKPKKCKIFAEKLEFLGHIISGDGICPDQAKTGPFEWTEECKIAQKKLKEILCQDPVLKFPDITKTFYVQTDYSNRKRICGDNRPQSTDHIYEKQ
jgi:hypothetical protein